MADLTRKVPHHDCRDELKDLDKRHLGLGEGSRATCSCGTKWVLGNPFTQLVTGGITGTRWTRVVPEAEKSSDGTPG